MYVRIYFFFRELVVGYLLVLLGLFYFNIFYWSCNFLEKIKFLIFLFRSWKLLKFVRMDLGDFCKVFVIGNIKKLSCKIVYEERKILD